MKKYLWGALCVVVLVGAVVAVWFRVSSQAPQGDAGKLHIVTSFYPLTFFAEEITGEKASVTTITPAGIEPHDYELSIRDLVSIQSADIVLVNGGGLEVWLEDVKHTLKGSDVVMVEVGQGLITKETDKEGETILDPHIWLDPTLAKQEVRRITQTIIEADSGNKEYYQLRTRDLLARLDSLHADFQQGLSQCRRRDFVTSHSAFGYLVAQYNLRQVPIAGLSPQEEPSLQELADIVSFVRQNDIKYIFFESLVSPDFSQTLARESGAQMLELNPIEGLTPDEIANGKDYTSVMRNNLANLVIALECTP